ncbi:MAG: hypothetical protein RMM28_11590 [Thermoleophilia bacterium]|nr:hypothetical protein [Gaiellaceae bacterium]MDW8339768.1 hypothetical protein [Thermoleophilia bacterium]
MRKLLIACAAAALAVALSGCGSGEEAAPATTGEPPPTTQTPETDTDATETAETRPETEAPPETTSVTTVRIVVRDGRPVGGIVRPKVRRGDQVVLVVTSDLAGDVHLHGYDLERPVAPGRPARLRFRATIPGRFEIELHAHPEVHIGELTVTP